MGNTAIIEAIRANLAPPALAQKPALERFVPPPREVHDGSELRLATHALEQRISDEVGIGKEAILDAVANHPQRRSPVTEDRISLCDLVGRFRIAHAVLLDPALQLIQDP